MISVFGEIDEDGFYYVSSDHCVMVSSGSKLCEGEKMVFRVAELNSKVQSVFTCGKLWVFRVGLCACLSFFPKHAQNARLFYLIGF